MTCIFRSVTAAARRGAGDRGGVRAGLGGGAVTAVGGGAGGTVLSETAGASSPASNCTGTIRAVASGAEGVVPAPDWIAAVVAATTAATTRQRRFIPLLVQRWPLHRMGPFVPLSEATGPPPATGNTRSWPTTGRTCREWCPIRRNPAFLGAIGAVSVAIGPKRSRTIEGSGGRDNPGRCSTDWKSHHPPNHSDPGALGPSQGQGSRRWGAAALSYTKPPCRRRLPVRSSRRRRR